MLRAITRTLQIRRSQSEETNQKISRKETTYTRPKQTRQDIRSFQPSGNQRIRSSSAE